MIIDRSGFRAPGHAQYATDNSGISDEKQVKTAGKTEEKHFLFEGIKDIYEALPENDGKITGGGPVYPAIGKKLYPLLDALETTVGQLGKHPTPEDVDKSNMRRIIRAFQPVAYTFRDSFPSKKFDKAMKRMKSVASAAGKYKDAAVVETEAKVLFPDGVLPAKIQDKLDSEREKRAEDFRETYKDFRKKGMQKALKVFTKPFETDEKNPKEIEKADRKIRQKGLAVQLDKFKQTGLLHTNPHEFHEGRKAARALLNMVKSSTDAFDFNKEDIENMTSLVTSYGIAQDKNIAYDWLSEKGFTEEASRMKELFLNDQAAALKEAEKFLESGAVERIADSSGIK